MFCFALCFAALVGRSAFLQLFPQAKLSKLKERQFGRTIKITPRRGSIYDRYGKRLAVSVPSPSLFADPYKVTTPYYMAKKLSKVLKVPKKTLLKKLLNKKRRFAWVKRHLTEQEVKIIKSFRFKGLHFIRESKRFYTKGTALSQVLGFTNIDGEGLEGVEKSYNQFLKGEEQRIFVKRDARGRPLFTDFTPFVNQVSGYDVHLTIDSDLQFYFEKELQKAMKKSEGQSAMGVVLSAKTAEVLAMVNLPNYNPNHPTKVKDKNHRRNRTVTDVFEPGSVLKTFTIISALKAGILPSKKYPTHKGKLAIGSKIITEADLKKKLKPFINLSEILSYSSNVGVTLLSFDIKQQAIRDNLIRFGFGQKTGIDFLGETAGRMRELPWRPIELATASYGHGISTSAIQVARAYAAIANGGFLKVPKLVNRISNPYNGEEKFFNTNKKDNKKNAILTKHHSQLMASMLTTVTESKGTGFLASVPGYLTAGKTGTAHKIDFEKGGYKKSEYISSFAGFIPAHNPEYVIYVVIDGAKHNFYASTLAAPVFSKVASYSLRKNNLSPTLFQERDFISSNQKDLESISTTRKPSSFKKTVPDLKGFSLRKALAEVKGQNIHLKIYGSNRVIRSIPFAGQALPKNKTITLILQ